MNLVGTSLYEIKKSKFYGYVYEILSVDDVKEILQQLHQEHKKSTHIPYAYILSNTAGKSDDKEPQNTAGTPLFRLLENRGLSGYAIFVVRYFGGVKLGSGGLLRSYVTAGKMAIEKLSNEDSLF